MRSRVKISMKTARKWLLTFTQLLCSTSASLREEISMLKEEVGRLEAGRQLSDLSMGKKRARHSVLNFTQLRCRGRAAQG